MLQAWFTSIRGSTAIKYPAKRRNGRGISRTDQAESAVTWICFMVDVDLVISATSRSAKSIFMDESCKVDINIVRCLRNAGHYVLPRCLVASSNNVPSVSLRGLLLL